MWDTYFYGFSQSSSWFVFSFWAGADEKSAKRNTNEITQKWIEDFLLEPLEMNKPSLLSHRIHWTGVFSFKNPPTKTTKCKWMKYWLFNRDPHFMANLIISTFHWIGWLHLLLRTRNFQPPSRGAKWMVFRIPHGKRCHVWNTLLGTNIAMEIPPVLMVFTRKDGDVHGLC